MTPSLRPRPRSTWLLAGVAVVGAGAAQAQTQTQSGVVAGTVVDQASRAPLPDARVSIAGTAVAVQTNARGEFRLANVRPGRVQVTVFRIGFRSGSDTVTVNAGATASLNFRLQASLTTLSEVVVSGTVGNQERRAQAATVSTVSAATIRETSPITNVNEMLQSRAPGVSVSSGSGSAGTSRQIRIRGAASLSLSNQPIVFVDGVRISEGVGGPLTGGGQTTDRINDLNPDDIESIEVVKGPAAATLYGADASTGVIQIITKRGRVGTNAFQQTVRGEFGQVDQNWAPPDNYFACTAALVAATSTNPLCRGRRRGRWSATTRSCARAASAPGRTCSPGGRGAGAARTTATSSASAATGTSARCRTTSSSASRCARTSTSRPRRS
jgi:TonB-dependent SusC/RagA subfamily outer membrane receptor